MSQPNSATVAPCRVAVVDDDDAVRRAVGRLLRVTGHQVRTYASAEEFLGAAPSEVDCLILDVYLGGMNGFDLHGLLTAVGQAPPTVFGRAGRFPRQRCHPASRRRRILADHPEVQQGSADRAEPH